ncbi:2-oxo acid dehydrogenase subunit E2 [Micavibrio aeruginosavorus]|uniref:Dihydrolipoamide acetyltransferase component of pyruvate dehydrogenase complex n=1 Tax=Micavibrio aeruginosavorus EPB TaxID=349215 RepID=M4VHN0_9BACT|nr:2-oxo acid dehydrogenase subunit E2 [Micavibrio aeruginosavorus]AGH98718.1 Dihydrolipoamide acyltransferase [Micavibrio aeruginosavorus EPB]
MSNLFEMRVPQLGESTRSVKVLKLLKSEGDRVSADESLLEVETNKAVMEIPAPISGVVNQILVDAGATIDVGEIIVRIDGQNPVHVLGDNFGQKRKGEQRVPRVSNDPAWRQENLPPLQVSLIKNMVHSKRDIVQVSIESQVNWSYIDDLKKAYRKSSADKISSLGLFTWACGEAMRSFDKFRARLIDDARIEINESAHIGIAKSCGDDVLLTPVITLSGGPNHFEVQSKLKALLSDANASSAYHSVSISDMSAFDTIRGTPIVVSPSVATLFIGTPYWGFDRDGSKVRISNLILSFDHRVINGVYAANFLSRIKRNIASLRRRECGAA